MNIPFRSGNTGHASGNESILTINQFREKISYNNSGCSPLQMDVSGKILQIQFYVGKNNEPYQCKSV
jgi:hypothetical protein